MKHIITLVLLVISVSSLQAQANTFPTSGNVGIGTTTPSARLQINSDGTTSHYIAFDKNANQETGIEFRKSGGILFYLFNDSDDGLKIRANGTGENDLTPRIWLPFTNNDLYLSTAGGNVAIGHTNPSYRLDVLGPENDWKARFQGPDGYILIGPANSGWAHIYTDRPGFIFNHNVWSITGGFSAYEDADLTLMTDGTTRVTVSQATGNVGIGTTNPNEKLTVDGTIYAKEVKVDLSVPGPDYVFDKPYNLPTLEEVRRYIDQYKHLPDVPSAEEMKKDGIRLAEMNMILLKKVEELTLYIMQQQREIEKIKINCSASEDINR